MKFFGKVARDERRWMKVCYLLIALFSFSLLACNHSDTNRKIPDEVMSKEKLINVMVDMYVIESAHNLRIMERDTAMPTYSGFYASVLQKYNITLKDYQNSLQFYSEDQDDINCIYDTVLEKLTKMSSEVDAQHGITKDRGIKDEWIHPK